MPYNYTASINMPEMTVSMFDLNKYVVFLQEVTHFVVRVWIAKERHSSNVFRIVVVCVSVYVDLKPTQLTLY